MVAEAELSRFLAELDVRRRRLTVAGTAGPSFDADVLAELAELGEQLIVADEELRAQHDELEAGREALLRSTASYERLLVELPTAYLLTDEHGMVHQLNPAAEALLGESLAGQRASRPLATKFQVADRGRIRTLLSELKRSAGEPASCRAGLLRRDGSLVQVQVTARLVSGPVAEHATLSWQLSPVGAHGGLHSVPPIELPAPPEESEPSLTRLLGELAEVAALLADQSNAQQVLDQAVRSAKNAVPGADEASISLVDKDGALSTPSSTGELATECDRAQYQLGEGPCLQAMWDGEVLQVDDLRTETRWPAWTVRAQELGAGSLLACQLAAPRQVLGALNLYSSRPAAFDSAAAALLPVLGVQVGIALARVRNEANLQQAVQSRQLIGQAVGILMERHRLGPSAAFDLLVRASQSSNLKLLEIARRVNETGQEPADAARPR